MDALPGQEVAVRVLSLNPYKDTILNSERKLIIVFVKNTERGSVKTRLAKVIGHARAREVYNELVDITREAVNSLPFDKWVYFSEAENRTQWASDHTAVQHGNDLGEKMCNAFKDAFRAGYEEVILIGSDLPDISGTIIESAFDSLGNAEMVLGPADDGGYYLVGMTRLIDGVFRDKPWSQPQLLQSTLDELKANKMSVSLLQSLNDVDTYEDYVRSSIYERIKDPKIEA